jgi:UDP-glucose 4-epimerase
MKMLVTGGTGYIGSHTVVELQKKGFEVIIADNLSNSSAGVVDSIERITGIRPVFEKVDLAEEQPTRELFNRHPGLNSVIHFAAFKAVGESVLHPLRYYRNNLGSLMNILKEMEIHGIRDLVFSSSCTVYGQPDVLPVSESAPIKKAASPYGNTKQIAEEVITDVSSVTDLRAVLLRYFNPIGAHESSLIGELPLGVPNNLMPYITQTAIGKREFLSVWGTDYNTPDGTAIRDYIHVVDIAAAHVVAIERLLEGKNKQNVEIFNLGTGIGYSVLDVIKSFEKTTGVKVAHKLMGRRPGDVEKVWADTGFANRELGWKAERDLDEMTLSAWNWEKMLLEE